MAEEPVSYTHLDVYKRQEKTIAAGEDIYCIRSDGDGWMYVRAKDGTEGFLPVTQM